MCSILANLSFGLYISSYTFSPDFQLSVSIEGCYWSKYPSTKIWAYGTRMDAIFLLSMNNVIVTSHVVTKTQQLVSTFELGTFVAVNTLLNYLVNRK